MGFMTSPVTPAPEGLELIRKFVNTLDIEEGTDALVDDERAAEWLSDQGFVYPRESSTGANAAYLRELRAALREALAANHSGSLLTEETATALNEAITRSNLTPVVDTDATVVLRSHSGHLDRLVGALVEQMTSAMSEGTWKRLKICSNDRCQWAFYDRSPARSGKWCSMSICGNRTKQQSWRQRRRR